MSGGSRRTCPNRFRAAVPGEVGHASGGDGGDGQRRDRVVARSRRPGDRRRRRRATGPTLRFPPKSWPRPTSRRRPRCPLRRRGRRGAPGVDVPAVGRPAVTWADERDRERAGLRGRRGGRAGALVTRRPSAPTRRPPRGEVATSRGPRTACRPLRRSGEGRGGAPPRHPRERHPALARRTPPAGVHVPTRLGAEHPQPLRGALPAACSRGPLPPVLPLPSGLHLQTVHADDVADAYRRVVLGDPLARSTSPRSRCSTRPLAAPSARARWPCRPRRFAPPRASPGGCGCSPPSPAGWTWGWPSRSWTRCASVGELGWEPTHTADAALLELLEGIRDHAGAPTPPLDPGAGGRLRIGELLSGVGSRSR